MTKTPVGELLASAERTLAAAGIEQPRREARLLLAHALGIEAGAIVTMDRTTLVDADNLETLVARRAEHVPAAYLTGRQGFWTLDLAVSDATLIPRADSETLIEALLIARPERAGVHRILDLGTGTGCLLLAALSEYSGAWGVGVDLSPEACRLAAANAGSNGLGGRAVFLAGDWGDALVGQFDVILSNPPYIPAPDIVGLMAEVVRHEPRRALDGGADGLDAYRRIVPILLRCLAADGLAVLEVGIGQAADVAALVGQAAGLVVRDIRADLGGVPRAVLLGRDPGARKILGMNPLKS